MIYLQKFSGIFCDFSDFSDLISRNVFSDFLDYFCSEFLDVFRGFLEEELMIKLISCKMLLDRLFLSHSGCSAQPTSQ